MEAYIVKAYRSAVGKSKKGSFRNFRSDDLAAAVIRQLMADTPGLEPAHIDDVLVGCANPEGEQGLQIGLVDFVAFCTTLLRRNVGEYGA